MLAPAIAIMVIAIIIKMIIKKITMLMTKMRVITTITRFAQFDRLKHGKSSECLKLSQQIVLFFDAGNSCAAGFKTHDSKFPKKTSSYKIRRNMAICQNWPQWFSPKFAGEIGHNWPRQSLVPSGGHTPRCRTTFAILHLNSPPREAREQTLKIWQCVKTLYPCSSHENSW